MTREVITVAAGPVGLHASSYFWKYSENHEDIRNFAYSETQEKFFTRMIAIFPEEDLSTSASDGKTSSSNFRESHVEDLPEGEEDVLHTFQEVLSLNIEEGGSFIHPATRDEHASEYSIARHVETVYSHASLQPRGVLPLSEQSYAAGNGNMSKDTQRIMEAIRSFMEECDLPDGLQFFTQTNNLYGRVVATLLPMIHEEFGQVVNVVQGFGAAHSLGIDKSILSENERPNCHIAQSLLDLTSILNIHDSCTMILPHTETNYGSMNQNQSNQMEYIGASHLLFADGYHEFESQRRRRCTLHELGSRLISKSSARILSTHMGSFNHSESISYAEPSGSFAYHALYPIDDIAKQSETRLSSQFISMRGPAGAVTNPYMWSLFDDAEYLPGYRKLYAGHPHPINLMTSAYEAERCTKMLNRELPLNFQQNPLFAYFEGSSRIGSRFLRPLYSPVAHYRRLPYGVLHRLRGSCTILEDDEWEVLNDRLCTLVENHEDTT